MVSGVGLVCGFSMIGRLRGMRGLMMRGLRMVSGVGLVCGFSMIGRLHGIRGLIMRGLRGLGRLGVIRGLYMLHIACLGVPGLVMARGLVVRNMHGIGGILLPTAVGLVVSVVLLMIIIDVDRGRHRYGVRMLRLSGVLRDGSQLLGLGEHGGGEQADGPAGGQYIGLQHGDELGRISASVRAH